MIKPLFILIFLTFQLYSKDFFVCSYNVENLFDLKNDRSDYKEYIPNSSSNWNKTIFNKKLSNTIKVIKDLNCDIIALQEIENKNLIKLLQNKLPEYRYISFAKTKDSSVGLGFLSKLEIIKNSTIDIKFDKKKFRPILETTFKVDNDEFKIFNNHWPSKRSKESFRVIYAKKLFDRVSSLPRGYDYILLGDFNSNYNEFKTIYYEKDLNDTYGVTGINQVLNTTLNKQYITLDDILKEDRRVHYNPWLELPNRDRFSTIFRGEYNTPDNIILSPALFDSKNISYVKKSFSVFKPNYLFNKNQIYRWQIKNGVHQGEGYSDHLPIKAQFTTEKNFKVTKEENYRSNIAFLYKKIKLIEPITIENAIVIYKNSDSAIIKQKKGRAIFIYSGAKDLLEGDSYNLKIHQISDYFGLKEINKFSIIRKNGKVEGYKSLYINGDSIDFEDQQYQNEIVTNIQGIYKNRKLYFNGKTINIYFKNKSFIPKDSSNIIIKRAQIGYYKSNIQLVINNRSDIDVN